MSGKEELVKALQACNEARWKKEAEEALLNSPRLPPVMAARKKIDSWHRQWEHKDRWIPLTPEELEALGDEAIRDCNEYQEQLMRDEPTVGNLEPVTKSYFTCYRCSRASTCPYVYDPYNSQDDCLADK
jgi:hypothetical protein